MSDTSLILAASDPMAEVAIATKQADALMSIVKKRPDLTKQIGDKDFLKVEAWQTIARFNGYLIDIIWSRPMLENGVKVGYEARAELLRIFDNEHQSGAEAECRFDEVLESDGVDVIRWEDDYACRSMAQTRAQGKVGRSNFAWVAVLAGFSPTPAEEMDGVKSKADNSTFPFGDYKGKRPDEVPLDVLQEQLPFWKSKAEDKSNKFAAKNARLVKAIEAAIEAKTPKEESKQEKPPEEFITTAEWNDVAKVIEYKYEGLSGAEAMEIESAVLRICGAKTITKIPKRLLELILMLVQSKAKFNEIADGKLAKLSPEDIAKWTKQCKLKIGREVTEQVPVAS